MSQPKAKWTILTYIAAHNNLEALGRRSLSQILETGSSNQVRLAALYDGPSGATRYIAGEQGKAAVEEPLCAFDSGSAEGLLETTCWTFEQCPAEHYGLILWSHGSGWRPEELHQVARQVRGDDQVGDKESTSRAAAPGSMALFRSSVAQMLRPDKPADRAVLFDDGTGHCLDTLQLEQVTGEIQRTIGQPLDLLGMDACLMATLEVAYQLRSTVRYLVASQELVPGFSWPYDVIFGGLRDQPGQPADQLAAAVVQQYLAFYTAHPPGAGDVTKVALDLSRVGELAQAVDCLASAIRAEMPGCAAPLWEAQYAAFKQESRESNRKPNKFQYHLWDIRSLAARLTGGGFSPPIQAAAQTLLEALKPGRSPVLAEGHARDWFDGIGGVSIYMVPPQKQRIAPGYKSLALAKDTHWGTLLSEYHEALASL